ncbi:MAG: hypothetical protein HND53_05575 [Proteobacteria bacterium]|nr:hypothetical protein [Pseudomonadota bacterium]NOG59952.1 hypothetical protein [Pseudomonadota bacterium]
MDINSKIIIALIILAFAILSLKLALGINTNIKTGERFRQQLKVRLDNLPIIKMLDKRDIDINQYISRVPITEIEKHAHTCSVCSANKICEETLLKEKSFKSDFKFCHNNEDFEQIKKDEITSIEDDSL